MVCYIISTINVLIVGNVILYKHTSVKSLNSNSGSVNQPFEIIGKVLIPIKPDVVDMLQKLHRLDFRTFSISLFHQVGC